MILRRRVRSYVHGSHVAKDGFTRRAAGGGPVPVVWENGVKVTIDGSSILKNFADSLWNAGAASAQNSDTDVEVFARPNETNLSKMFGLSAGDTDQGFTDIDFAIFLRATADIQIYEGGVLVSTPGVSYLASDVFSVRRVGTTITYHKNGEAAFYTSGTPSTGTLLVDCSIQEDGGGFAEVTVEGV